MSYRYNNAFVKPGLNTLVAPTPSYQLGLWSFGRNNLGQLGLNNTTYYSSPKHVGSLSDWKKINSANNAQAACFSIKSDGTLWAWGYNSSSGHLGLNNTNNYSSPKQVGALTNWLYIASGSYHCAAIKTDGTLWSWGRNNLGQLGLGNTTNYSSPKQVGVLTNWLYVSCGPYATYSIKTDGTLWSWGFGYQGQLGLGNTTYYSSPKQVGSLTNWKTLPDKSIYYMFGAIKTDGTLWTWGSNNSGGLGLNTTTYYSSPKQVGALTNWSSISVGNTCAAIKTDGTIWTWGNNGNGQLGLGNTTNYSSPKQVGSSANWSKVSSGGYSMLSIKTDGTLWAWGVNGDGQLGLGTTTAYSSPKQVGALTTWFEISTTSYSTIALQA